MGIDGFALSNFRSFGEEKQYIKDLGKVNSIIGKNNSGKSNLSRFTNKLSQICQLKKQHEKKTLFNKFIDSHMGNENKPLEFSFQIKKNSSHTGHIYEHISKFFPRLEEKIPEWAEEIWISFEINDLNNPTPVLSNINYYKDMISNGYKQNYDQILNKMHLTGGTRESQLTAICGHFDILHLISFVVESIESYRSISVSNDDNWDINGVGLIKKLNQLKEPTLGNEKDRERFDEICNFVRELLNREDAKIEIPYTADQIYIVMDNRRLPLDSLGTGIHQVIILAAAATLIENSIVCIEEPEVYLHPELQRKFIDYIVNYTNNQYLLTTHSNAVFDNDDINIYHCQMNAGKSNVTLVSTILEKNHILNDLGYKASDILQSNCVIWVEGPSDRVYVKKWIKDKDKSLKEGIHFSIMFYGGRLLNHLTVEDDEIDEFIKLGRINRFAAIIMDSDKKSPQSHINATKKRIIDEFNKNGYCVWITKGKEIENYVDESTLMNSISEVHGDNILHPQYGVFNVVSTIQKNGKLISIDKISVAKRVTTKNTDYSVLDLNQKMDDLIRFIHQANLRINEK
ncbi:AAA family ATPase [Paenibacillus qinlingensis]|uniref:AAA family ATPase n=1 Tax=Paenibacillus qinlingensis TaxID=1837343 RepID=UPI001566DD5A|nr:AAA family ATPase [Paenibacillus qinlingensis]NQX63261.1 ATP-binding protein [Paenibacillus qinlingensis]